MAVVIVDESSLENIADAIRSKNGSSDTYKPAEMADAISAISGGGITPTGTKTISITQNGTTTEDVTNYASAQIAVNVPNPSTGTLSIKKDGTYNVTDYASVEVKTAMEKVNVTGTTVTQELAPNKFYVFGEVTSLTITLGTGDSDLANDYHFRFTSGSTATVLSLPQTVNMPTGFAVEASKVYEISIVDNYGTVTSW